MEKIILSLKNIYRLLLNDDFPIYSERVISKKQRKGQTLQRFWKEMMAPEFCALPYGKMIWRDDGRRCRFFSNLCNRNEELKYYHEYAKELGTQISPETLLSQLRRFQDFLQSREYSHEMLQYRSKGFLRALEDDECITEAIRAHLEQVISAVEAGPDFDPEGSAFRAAYLLTVMTLYASAGIAMGDPPLAALREEGCSMEALWAEQCRRREQGSGEVKILTAHTGLLQTSSLSKDRFFGREAELFDLRDLAVSGKKCLISGIGGVGKTELLRQLIRRCREEHLVDKLAIIPYRTDLAESMIYAFPELRQQKQEETLNCALHRLEREAQEAPLLLLIDNVTNDTDTDADLLRLAALPCTVMVTSRRKNLKGFEVYPLSAPNTEACALIFRDNYGSPLSDADRRELGELLSDPVFCHPLTLRLMARAAKSKSWSVGALRGRLRQGDRALTWPENGRQISIGQIFTQLYPSNQIPKGCQTVMQLFTLLPRDSYQVDVLLEDFPLLFQECADLEQDLSMLVSHSLLERDDTGYSMHPLIAQCLRRKTLPESYLEQFLSGPRQRLARLESDEDAWAEKQRVGQLFLHISQFLTGSISAGLLLDLMDAAVNQCPTKQQKLQYIERMTALLRRCPDKDDTLELVLNTLLCQWDFGEEARMRELFKKQCTCLTVPMRRFLDFCLAYNMQFSVAQPEQAEPILQVVLDSPEATVRQRAEAYWVLTVTAEYLGKPEALLQWAEVYAAFALQHPECGQRQTFNSLVGLSFAYLKFGRGAEAKPLLEKMEKLERKLATPWATLQYLQCLGTYELYFGDLENAARAVEKTLAIVDDYFGRFINYYSTLNQLALIYQRQKRFDEAKNAYEEILAHGKDQDYFNLARNNYATLLLDMGNPQAAMPHITEVLAAVRPLGGITLGEALRNKARAHGLLGEDGPEYECLKEALPLLEQAYGPEHPKVLAAKQRFAELSGQK